MMITKYFKLFLLYLRTIKHLKLSQIYWRIIFNAYKPYLRTCRDFSLRKQQQKFIQPVIKPTTRINENIYNYLNEAHDISSSSIWNDCDIAKLWLYNLHYFNTYDKNLIIRWIKENPQKKGIGWESYPTSLRIVNWIKQSLTNHSFSDEMLRSLFTQARWLSRRIEWHILGNHLIANAKALIFAGLFFSGKEADRWLSKGCNILNKQLKQQILSNGSHFELTPMYHAIILEDMLDLINIVQVYNCPVPSTWINLIPKMFAWLKHISHPDGKIAFFNDSSLNIASETNKLITYAQNLEINLTTKHKIKPINYYRLEKNHLTLIADVGAIGSNYQPGHAHADSLSFELSIDRQRILVNSGISCYAISREREYQRGTQSHNTVMIDNTNSSETWSSFRVGRRAQIISKSFFTENQYFILTACHNGYSHIIGKPIHQRSWKLNNKELFVTDIITGKFEHNVKIFFHFYPGINLIKTNNNHIEIENSHGKKIATMIAPKQTKIFIENSNYFPTFGKAIPNKRIIIEKYDKLPLKMITQLSLDE